MRREAAYLRIPQNYATRLGGLAWATRGDAIEWVERDGSGEPVQTFLLPAELALFLDGLAVGRGGRLLHFGHVLHLLNALGVRPRPYDPEETLPPPPPACLARLARVFEAEGRPLRNAGVFCGRICREVADDPDAPEPNELRHWLANDGPRVSMLLRSRGQTQGNWEPALGPDDFEHFLAASIEPIHSEEIATWFRNGTGPIGDVEDQLAEGILAIKPRSLEAALAALARRDRLAGAVPMVDPLDSALALPPRRSLPQTLPTGGYADIGTRGRPEQILPSQFGLDALEFLRRHAERELLYFQREEPHRSTTEELVLLLDQGVRTWGKPRLALSAAALALAKRSIRKGQEVLVGGTSSLGKLFDPRLADDEALGVLWEASDLTASPAAALRVVLGEPGAEGGTPARDVVLLTHPRSAVMPDVLEAARHVPDGVRVFAVAIDESGRVLVREYRGGAILKVGDFRVRWPEPRLPEPSPEPPISPRSAWTGDVEPVGYPFAFSWDEPPSPILLDFDPDGEWLYAASPEGLVHAWRTDGTSEETVPRTLIEDEVFDKVDAILGVRGGFVIAGRQARSLVVAHYDMTTRRVQARVLGSTWNQPWQWFYMKEDHLIVARGRDLCRGFDLASKKVYLSRGGRQRVPLRMIRAFERANNHLFPPPFLKAVHDRTEHPDRGEWVNLERKTGQVTLHGLAVNWEFTPLSDGRPALKESWIEHAQRRGDILALVTCQTNEEAVLRIIHGPTGETLRERRHVPTRLRFLLSSDARWLVRSIDSRRFDLRRLDGPGHRVSLSLLAQGEAERPEVTLGRGGLIVKSRSIHLMIYWRGGRLMVSQLGPGFNVVDPSSASAGSGDQELDHWVRLGVGLTSGSGPRPDHLIFDSNRFVAGTQCGHLYAVIDRQGQIILWGRSAGLVAVLHATGPVLRAWTPDGATWPLVPGTNSPRPHEALDRRLAELLQRAEAHFPALPAPSGFDLNPTPPVRPAEPRP